MSKLYFFMNTDPAPTGTPTILPDVYCPTGGYHDKNLNKTFTSRGEKFRYLRSKGMREAEIFNPDKSLGGTNGANTKQRGDKGNFRTRPMPTWMRQELSRIAGG